MPGPSPVAAKQSSNWAEFPVKLGAPLVPFVKEVQTIKNLAQSFLSGVWFLQGIPRIISMIPTNVEGILPFFKWTEMLKPYEKFFGTLKDIGNMFDLPEKMVALRNVKAEWAGDSKTPQNKWKAVYRITSVFYVSLDALVLIPQKWNLWNLMAIGNWAARIGVTTFGLTAVKDGFTALSSAINVRAEGINRANALGVIKKCQKRIDPKGPLAELKEHLAVKETLTPEVLQKIDSLKKDYWATQFGTEVKKDKKAVKTKLEGEIEKARQDKTKALEKLAELRKSQPQGSSKIAAQEQAIQTIDQTIETKREKVARIQVWSEKATPDKAQLDRLRAVVVYKSAKNDIRIANANMIKEKATIIRWFEVSKCAVIIFTYLMWLGVAALLAPYLGLSALTIGSIFFVGQWITGISTGICGFGRTMAMHRFKDSFKLPQTHLLRA